MNLITDRTAHDVERWKVLRDKGWEGMTETERQEWLGEINVVPSAAKGMYTHNDLNRVESAVKVLSERLTELGYLDELIEVKTDWTYSDEVNVGVMERYYYNVATLRKYSTLFGDTPEVPTINRNLNYERANNIEKILADIDVITTNIPKSWYYVGEVMSGEV